MVPGMQPNLSARYWKGHPADDLGFFAYNEQKIGFKISVKEYLEMTMQVKWSLANRSFLIAFLKL